MLSLADQIMPYPHLRRCLWMLYSENEAVWFGRGKVGEFPAPSHRYVYVNVVLRARLSRLLMFNKVDTGHNTFYIPSIRYEGTNVMI